MFFSINNFSLILSLLYRTLVLNLIQCLSQIFDDIIDVLCTNAQADGAGCDVLLCQLLG